MTLKMTLSLLLLGAIANADCSRLLEYGNPAAKDVSVVDIEMCKDDGLLVGYDYTTKQPRWVGVFLDENNAYDRQYATHTNRADDELPEFAQSTLGDYRGSGYEKLHFILSGSLKGSVSEFLLSNVSPANAAFKRDIWTALNDKMRRRAVSSGGAVIYAGPIFAEPTRRIGENKIPLPTHFYKIMYAPREQRMWALILPNRAMKNREIQKWVTTVDAIEERTGIDFFTSLPDTLEARLEKRKEFL